ncbi:hypothetical protein [Pelomonas cellulosilytica]|uniref:Uncharacterized protein n=1 Tax=Pelomonas cellulosilytica TaxID=2906762 RepID=A0ABS8XPP0_9BURK|nr:hypothetical protein [Pelomonas sp. P8]MCE4554719.1 hypothetical protein [Pelomonas sp. P8]
MKQFTERVVNTGAGMVIGGPGGKARAKNFLTLFRNPAMQIKPPSAIQNTAAAAPPPRPGAAASGNFAQLLKTAQAETPAAPAAAGTSAKA